MRHLAYITIVGLLAISGCKEKEEPVDTGNDADGDTDSDTDSDTDGDTDADTDPDGNEDWDWTAMTPDPGTSWVFRNAATGVDFPAIILPDETVDGAAYTPFAIGDFSSIADERFLIDFDFSTPFVLGVKRMAWYWERQAEPFEDYVLTPPLSMPLLDEVGASETYSAEGTLNGDDSMTVTATTTLLEKGVSVDVPMGTVADCRHYRVDLEMGFSLPIEVWVHHQYAFVKSTDFIGGAQWELVSFTPSE